MGEFFKGWRRKIGLVVLMLAFVFMGFLARSFDLSVGVAGFKNDSFFATNGSFIWERQHSNGKTTTTTGENAIRWGRVKVASGTSFFQNPLIKWYWQWCGIGSGEYQYKGGMRNVFWAIPHWFIILLLTLLSGYLLLKKPKTSNQIKITEPIANDGEVAAS